MRRGPENGREGYRSSLLEHVPFPTESERALDSSFGAYSYRRTGAHFAGICANQKVVETPVRLPASARRPAAHGAAAVAGPAARRMLLSEVAADEDASAFLGLRVVGDGPKPALTLVTKCLELRHEITDAGAEALERYHEADKALVIALDEAGLLKIGEQYLTDPARHTGRIRKRGGGWGALLARPGGERGLEPVEVADGRTAQGLKPLLDLEVGRVEQQDAVRRPPVASGAPDLLYVLFERAGSLVMDDVANVRLVDPHAEGARRDHDQAS